MNKRNFRKKEVLLALEKPKFFHFISAIGRSLSQLSWKHFSIILLMAVVFSACEKDPALGDLEIEETEDEFRYGDIQWPNTNQCRTSPPPPPFKDVGFSWKRDWHQIVRNENQLANAIRHVNANGGMIYIDGSFSVTRELPKITRNNIKIKSRKGNIIYDKISGGNRASELFRVEASNFSMQSVTIYGVGHTNKNNPSSWRGKRSAVAVTKNNSHFTRVNIRYYTHAAIRLENGSGHKVINSILTNQSRSDLGYGVLLRNRARNVLIKRNRFDRNTHSVATTGGRDQSYRAEGNWTTNSGKWHFDVHMGQDDWGGNKIEIIHNVSNGSQSLLLVRGPFKNGVYVKKNLYNKGAGKLVELKPDRTFTRNGTKFNAGQFYSPFGLDRFKARAFFRNGEIINNCVGRNYNALLSQAGG